MGDHGTIFPGNVNDNTSTDSCIIIHNFYLQMREKGVMI